LFFATNPQRRRQSNQPLVPASSLIIIRRDASFYRSHGNLVLSICSAAGYNRLHLVVAGTRELGPGR
jgi:hypothetical protein